MKFKRTGIFLFIVLTCLNLSAEELPWQTARVVDLIGVYDTNGNFQAEYFTVLEGGPGTNPSLAIRYIEIDAAGFQTILWDLSFPAEVKARFVGLQRVDFQGDEVPELVILVNISEAGGNLRQPVIYVYELQDGIFSEEPTIVFDISEQLGYLRCNNIQTLDRDGDLNDELIVSLGSPRRSLAIIDYNDENQLEITQELVPSSLKSGSGFIYTAAIDYDRNGYDDLVVFSPEGSVVKAQPFYNSAGLLEEGLSEEIIVPGLNGLLERALLVADWDSDGFRDVLLAFRSGHLVTLTMTPVGLPLELLDITAGPLSDVNVADFNQDDISDLLLVSGEMNMLTLVSGGSDLIEYYTIEGEGKAQIFNTLPILSRGLYTGTIIAASWDGMLSDVFISDLGVEPSEITEAEVTTDSSSASLPGFDIITAFPEIAVPEMKMPEKTVIDIPTGSRLPEGVLPRHILTVGQTFAYTIPETDMQQFYSFRWLDPPPKGMFFHYESRSIRWVPSPDQLGAYKLAYQVEMKVGETIDLESIEPDSLVTYQVVPELESYAERLWVYVNDPPRIISQPGEVEFVADELFEYQPEVFDRNLDARISYSLEAGPQGMNMDEFGKLTWQTDSTSTAAYPVRIVANDGFDRTSQEFILYPQAGISIISAADTSAVVNTEYKYSVEVWKPDIDIPLKFDLPESPLGMEIDAEGKIIWTPTVNQIDYQYFTVVAIHSVASDTQRVMVFVNHPPVIEAAPAPMEMIRLGETYDFQIRASDPNASDQLQYTALVLPYGMRMDPFNGRLQWEPSAETVDFSQLLIAVSDGRETRMIEAEFFVNAPISIVSVPPVLAQVGAEYRYQVNTSDLNRGNLLPFDRVTTVEDSRSIRIYSVDLSDEVYKTNIQRYIGDWNARDAIYIDNTSQRDDGSVSRLNLKKYTHSIFYEQDRLVVILKTIDQRTVSIKDVLWEFFQGNKGKPPRVAVERLPVTHYTLNEFPDGMTVDELTGVISWTPRNNQAGFYPVELMVSDGYLYSEQEFEVYVNHPPVIISNAERNALVGDLYKYQIITEDANSDADLRYSLIKGPQGMQISRKGRVVWTPTPAQIDEHSFTVKVSDGYREDSQTSHIFVNIKPSILSTPKPVALTGYEYRYKLVVEDLNKDRITFRPLKIPKYANFNPRTGLLIWKPKSVQKGINDVIIMAIDERGAATTHEFQIHVFEDPSNRQMMSTGWPLLLTFVGVIFAWGVAQF